MPRQNRRFVSRLAAVIAAVVGAAAVLVVVAVNTAGVGRVQLNSLARTEIEADVLARDFSGDVDDLHSTMLTLGRKPAELTGPTMVRLRAAMQQWVRDREAAAHDDEERNLVRVLANEMAEYFRQIDAVVAPPGAAQEPLTPAQIIAFDNMSVRLQGLADDFANMHVRRLREILAGSLASMRRLRDIAFTCLTLLAAAGGTMGVVFYRDLVRPLRLLVVDREKALARGEKLAALGTLAAGVAHEIRNPLTAVNARLYALRRADVNEVVRGDLTAIQHEIRRLERIVTDVLDYGRPGEPNFAELELTAWLRDCAESLRPEMESAGIDLQVEIDGPVIVRADGEKLQQVLINLARNAREALVSARGGRIVLSAYGATTSLRGRIVRSAIFAVTDNGPGIPMEIRDRLFDPFFTTKAAGTGLGLAIIARIMERHGGDIAVQSAPGGGARFEVRLPLLPL
jgi:signal transduction histidine kinase